MNNVVVGKYIILPRLFWSQIEHPYVAKNKNLNLAGRGRRPRRPEDATVTAVHPSVI